MSEGDRRGTYCGRCGNAMQEGDRFCGTCGAAVLPPAPRAEQVIPEPAAAAQGGTPRRGRRSLLAVGVVVALLVLLAGGGALALVGLGPAAGLLGGSEPPSRQPSDRGKANSSGSGQTGGYTTTESTAPRPTTVDLMQRFVSDYYSALWGEDWAAAYSMLDEDSKRKITEEEWTRAQSALATSDGSSPIVSAIVEGPYVSETQVPFSTKVKITHEDGTSETREVTLVSEYVVDDADDFHRHLTDEELSYLRGALARGSAGESTASATPEPTAGPETTTSDLQPEGADQVREAAQQYYLAVDYREWDYTYFNLDSESQALFTEEEWAQKNRWYAEQDDPELDSMSIDVTMEGSTRAKVTVDRTFADGTFISRDTYFVWEDGWWRHHLTEEEKSIFMPGVPFEEFVAAQQG